MDHSQIFGPDKKGHFKTSKRSQLKEIGKKMNFTGHLDPWSLPLGEA